MAKYTSTFIHARALAGRRVMPPLSLFATGLIGIDEAGRGPLAGPLVVAAVRWTGTRDEYRRFFRGIEDSKKLTRIGREEWYLKLQNETRFSSAVSLVSPAVVDRINIARAADRGALRAYQKVAVGATLPALLDGSLYLPRTLPFQTIIRGDEKVALISAASVIAKVTRDRLMKRLHKKYPAYSFDVHKGYGTALHRARIGEHGISPVHRKTFCTRFV